MKLADVKFDWVGSVSDDVTAVRFTLVDMVGAELANVELLPEVTSYVVVGVPEKATYLASVTVTDGTNEAVTTLEVLVPDLGVPMGVTDLGYTIVNVYDFIPEPEVSPEA